MYLQIPVCDNDFNIEGEYELSLQIASITIFGIWESYRCAGIMFFGWGIELRW